ncbi:histone H1.1-like [Euphorbia lathyris]|uniref:histone H1.1-like n=1 Tax=Euphorbia lathyris TaxID=212925 RepID=UPI0033138680
MSPSVAAAKSKAKVAKESKSKNAASAPKKARSYPPYSQMINEAIVALKERTGSSHIAITKFIEEKQKSNLPANFKKLLFVQLKKLVANGKLVKVKNSFKLPSKSTPVSDAKAPKAKKEVSVKKVTGIKPKTAAKKAPITKTAKSPAKKAVKPAAVKTPVKKAAVAVIAKKKTPVKGVKKPKSIKSPVKKARVTRARK